MSQSESDDPVCTYLANLVMVNSCLVVLKRHEIEKIGCHFGFTVDHNNQRVVADFIISIGFSKF